MPNPNLKNPFHLARILGVIGFCAGVWFSVAIPASATVYYVDGNCPTAGSGLSTTCGSNGPKTNIDAGIALLSTGGDVLEIRGAHAAHDGETSSFDGRYHNDWYRVSKTGTAISPIIIQPYKYGLAGAEKVYLDGTTMPSSGWTQCSSCTSGACAGVPAAACSETWYATDTGMAKLVGGAQKPDGSPTYRVLSPGDLTNAHASYNPKRCSIETWRACNVNSDCDSGESCSAASPEIDSYSPGNGGPILVRWGTGANAPGGASNRKPYVNFNNNGFSFFFTNGSYVTARGFIVRCHEAAGIVVADNFGAVSNITVDNNKIYYSTDEYNAGADYGIQVWHSTNVVLSNNNIGYTGSEGVHTQARSGGTAITIRGNWVHDIGDQSVLGPGVGGTPTCMILGTDCLANCPGDYTGSLLDNNYCKNIVGRAIILEVNSSNWVISNNIVNGAGADCLHLDGTGSGGATISNNQIYNNIFLNCGNQGKFLGAGIYGVASSTSSVNNNKIYNNTFGSSFKEAIAIDCNGPCTGNVIRNNIMYDTGAKRLLYWPAAAIIQNNIVYSSTTGTLITAAGRNFTCSGTTTTIDIDGDGTANDNNRCVNPGFISAPGGDFHLGSSSPAIDAATVTGMPVGRIASVNNSLASLHSLPSYADNLPKSGTAWDVGAAERSSGITASIVLSDPSPTMAGNVTITLSTSVAVVNLPGPLTFMESDSSTTSIVLSGTVPGTSFTGTFVVNSSVAEGLGTFVLPANSLVDALGNTGNTISTGNQTVIDRTAPSGVSNLRFGM